MGSLPLEERLKQSPNLSQISCEQELYSIAEQLFVTLSNPRTPQECTKIIDVKTTSVETLLTDL
jgi:hypothetical protein